MKQFMETLRPKPVATPEKPGSDDTIVKIPTGIEKAIANTSSALERAPGISGDREVEMRSHEAIHLHADANEILNNDAMLSLTPEGSKLFISKFACPITFSDGSVRFARLARYAQPDGFLNRKQAAFDSDIRIIYADDESPWHIESDNLEGALRFEEGYKGALDLLRIVDPDDLVTPLKEQHEANRQEYLDHVRQIIEGIASASEKFYEQEMFDDTTGTEKSEADIQESTPEPVIPIKKENKKELTKGEKLAYGLFTAAASIALLASLTNNDSAEKPLPSPSHSTSFDKPRVHINPIEEDPFIRDYEEPDYIPPFADTDPAPSHPISSFPTTANEEPPTKQPLIEDPGYPGPDYSIPTAIMPTPPSESIDEPSISVPKLAPPTTEHSYPSRPVEDPNENSWTEPDYQYPRYYRPPTIYIPGQPYIPPHTN